MATKQEKAVQRAVKKERKLSKIRGEKHILWILVALVLILLYLLLAQHNDWWPYSKPKLGTAFYTNISANAAKPAASTSASTTSSAGTVSTSSGTTSTGSNSGSSGTGTSSTPTSSPSIATFSAGVNVGDTEAQTSAQANGLGQNCAVVASASTSASGLGQQEVCTYTQGDKVVTVTYLNGQVISASKSGF